MNNHLKNLIAFTILMENGNGILDKSPGYVVEKFIRYATSENEEEYKWGLDVFNRRKLKAYCKKWNQGGSS